MRRRLGLIAAVATVAAALALTGCSGGGGASPSGSGATSKLKVGLVILQSDSYFQSIQNSLKAAVEKDGGSVVVGQSNSDAGQEAQAVDNLIQSGVDAVLIQPTGDAASVPAMKKVKNAGIPLICYGNCTGPTADPSLVDGVIQSDNTALGTGTGKVAAKYIKDNLSGTAKIAILNCDIASTCKLRKAGFKQALADAGVNVTYVTDQEAYLVDKAQPVTTDILTASPDVNLIWSANEGGTSGATLAVQASGKKIAVFGTDISNQIIGFLKDAKNVLQATTGQDSAGTSQGAYQMAKTVKSGGKVANASVQLPGISYDRANPGTINSWTNVG